MRTKVPLSNIGKRARTYKLEERVIYKMIKEYIETKYGFKVHIAYIAEVKRDLGLPVYDAQKYGRGIETSSSGESGSN